MPKFPQRPWTHALETESETFFRQHLPVEWTMLNVRQDYGQDLLIEISEEGKMKGLGLIVQLKSSKTSTGNSTHEKLILRTVTYNYLRNRLEVVLLVKYVSSEHDAYWLLLNDVQPPGNAEQEKFTVSIPKTNKLSELDWNVIVDYVRTITKKS